MPSPIDLRRRRRQPEVMDQPGLDPAEHHRALDALTRINRWSAGMGALWGPVRDLCRAARAEGRAGPVRLLDVATGGGDLPVQLALKARKARLDLAVAGCDISPLAIDHAREHARRSGVSADFFLHDAVARPIPDGYDVVVSSLFLHHLDAPEAVALLRGLGAAARLVLIDDLRRGLAGWALAYVGVRVLAPRAKVAHVDGPISVEGAFTIDEARALAVEAGWADVTVAPRWPCRFLMTGRFA